MSQKSEPQFAPVRPQPLFNPPSFQDFNIALPLDHPGSAQQEKVPGFFGGTASPQSFGGIANDGMGRTKNPYLDGANDGY